MSEHETPDTDDELDVEAEAIKDLDAPDQGDDVKGGFRSMGCGY